MRHLSTKPVATTDPQLKQEDDQRHEDPKAHAARIKRELKEAGAVLYDLLLPVTKSIPLAIHNNEHIKAVVYGRYVDGTGVLVATEKRVLFINKKPLYIKSDDIKYSMVSAVSLSHVGPYGMLTLHTRLGDYSLKTFNLHSADLFYNFVDTRCIEQDRKDV